MGTDATLKSFATYEPWISRTVGETGKYINGLAFKPTDWGNDGMPIIRIQNLTNPTKPLNRTTREVDPIYVVNPGDILVSWSATLDVYIWDRVPSLLNQHIFKVVPDTTVVTKKFLFYTLKKAIAEMIKSEHLHGSTMKHINRGPFLAHKIEVPTLAQQQEIVDELEKQFSRLDEAVANLQRVKANLKRYKASVLKDAVEGRLVPTEAELARRDGRSFETGEQLLQRILETRRSQWKGKGKFVTPDGPSMTNLAALPEGWVWASAVQACEHVVDCHNKTAPYTTSGIPLVRTTNIRDGRLLLGEVRYVDQPTYEFWSRRCPPEPGDVLFTREAPMGEAGIIPPGVTLCLGQRTMLMRPSPAISAGFLLSALLSPVVKDLIDRVAVGSGVKHLRVGDVERLPVPLPPIAEQIRIVAEIDRRLSLVRSVEIEVGVNLARAQALRQSVLGKNFSG